MKDWYQSHSPREQIMILAAGVAIVLGLAYTLFLQPLYDGLDERRSRVEGNVNAIEWMQTEVSQRQFPTPGHCQRTHLPGTLSENKTDSRRHRSIFGCDGRDASGQNPAGLSAIKNAFLAARHGELSGQPAQRHRESSLIGFRRAAMARWPYPPAKPSTSTTPSPHRQPH